MKKIIAKSVIAVAAIGASVCAFANGGTYTPAPQSQFYVGANVGWAWHDMDQVVGLSRDQNYFGARVDAGYKFNEYVGVELGGAYLGKAKYQAPNGTETSFENWALDVMVVGSVPLYDKFNLIAKGGAAYVNVDSRAPILGYPGSNSDDIITGTFAGGVEYVFNTNVALNVFDQYYIGRGNFTNGGTYVPGVNLLTGGLTFYFG